MNSRDDADWLTAPPAFEPPPTDHSLANFLDPPTAPGDLGRLGHYRILKQIGEGGMGMVFHALDTQLGRNVAVKVIRPQISQTGDVQARFEQEARATAKIKHDHVVELYRFGHLGSVLFLEMPLLRGESLHARLQRETKLPVPEVLKVGRQMAEGLAAAHAAGLIHRDVKPANVFLSEETGGWRVRLLDLGLARANETDANLTRTGTILGTPAYMSPEQAQAQPLDARSDLFSLGVVLYHLLTGTNPFADRTFAATVLKITQTVPPAADRVRSDVPPELSRLIERLMAKAPTERPASALEVVDKLKQLQSGTTASNAKAFPVRSSVGQRRSSRQLVIGCSLTLTLAVLLCSIVLGTAVTLGWLNHAAKAPKVPLDLQLTLKAKKKSKDTLLSLDDANVLPLQAGDALRIEARTARPAYFYVLNLTADGQVALLYPWRDDDQWDSIGEEKPRDFYCIPEPAIGDASRLEAGPAGIESVVVLVRETPLTATERDQLRALLRTWPVDQGKFDPLRAAVTIGEDEVHFGDARDQQERGKVKPGDAVEANDPVLRLRRLLQGEVRSLGVASRGVCYTFKGK